MIAVVLILLGLIASNPNLQLHRFLAWFHQVFPAIIP
jgi:hypothetical protein